MILKPRKKFFEYMIGRRRESCDYREVYEARIDNTKFVLTVYDLGRTPSTLFTDETICAELVGMPREVQILTQVSGEQFPGLKEVTRAIYDGRDIVFFVQDYYPSCTIEDVIFQGVAPERRIVQAMDMIIKAVQEL